MLIKINRDVPLIGCIAFGILDRGTNLLQVRATSVCNLNCTFCSVDSGVNSKCHNVMYEVDCDYLLEEVEKVVKLKGDNVEINIDSVGEPFCYPELEKLVEGVRKIKGVVKVTIQTNGMLFKEVDVDLVNVSLHAMDESLAKKLSGVESYSLEKVKKFIDAYLEKGVRLCPVWIPGVNDEEMPKIIQYALDKKCSLGIQKYEVYKHSRRVGKVKSINWWKFYKQIEEWEQEFNTSLKVKAKDLGIVKAERLPEVFRKGEKVQLTVKCKGWFKDQMIAVGRNRCVSVNNCSREEGDLVNVTILETKNNIYLAE